VIASSWINGTPVSTGGAGHRVINPADGSVVAEFALATPVDVDTAVAAARAALPAWSAATPAERSAVLAKLAELVESHAGEIVAEEVSQTGKPVRLATEFDVPGSVDNIAFFAGAARHLEGKATAEYSADHTSSIRREAVGVVATITPWNYPLQMAVWKVIPALAAGCSVVIKPAELTPLTTLTLARLATEAGLPEGVFNVITVEALEAEKGWTSIRHGASWIYAVEFTEQGPRSEGFLSYSQSTDPTSPHHSDQTELYSRKGWDDLLWRDADVEKATVSRVTISE
jgi:betaine-aldehyde dehydrogenase